jgi:hypothetical protein
MAAQDRKRGSTNKPDYKRTPREEAALTKIRKGHAERVPRVKAVKADGGLTLKPDHPDETTGYVLLMEALGTTDFDFTIGLLGQLANAGSKGREIDVGNVNFMLAIIHGIKPRDQIEVMLAAQMAAVHMATITFARRLAHVDNIQQQDSAERAFNKLTRTFTTQMEALKRYRTGGEQKVTVQHVTVAEGGQAIVGNVTQGRREAVPDKAVSPLALNDVKTAPMPIVEAKSQVRVPLPRSSKSRRTASRPNVP